MFKGYAGAAIPRLQKLMDIAAKATEPTPNATIVDDEDRAASAQLYWMMLIPARVQHSTPWSWQETAKVSKLGDN